MQKRTARSKPHSKRQERVLAEAPARPRAKKVSLTVEESVLREVKSDARRAGRTLSAHVTEALARDLRRARLAELIREYEAEHGAITERELDQVRSRWQQG